MSRFSDFDMPDSWPEFPDCDQVLEWLNAYVDHFGFRPSIRTLTEVVQARPRNGGGWHLTLRGPSAEYTADYDALIAASGSYWDPQMPDWPGSFSGDLFHAQSYLDPRTPVDLRKKRVVIVGIGNTGCELACEIAKAGADQVYLSARSGTWVLPKTIDGVPAAEGVPLTHPSDEVPKELARLAEEDRETLLAQRASELIKQAHTERMAQFERLGFPPAPDHPLIKRPTICQDILPCLEAGDVCAKPEITRLEGKQVIFAESDRVEADVIICATGYRLSYPYLSRDLADTRSNDLTLFCGIVPPDRTDLFFVGVSRPTGAFWPIAEAQANFIAALLTHRYSLPEAGEVRRRARPMLDRLAMNPGLYGLSLREELARGRV